ncbi:class I SAM-dependent methyltransferase [Macrococcoides caseolyticum subsp. hominis]|uniref:class I SAM-dependent methyltransferase n=1 Tax=Macrococcoides caseolyticum TaxID=69966 RepID=UPI000C15C740|nr:class I SAM-dependent methyltransferase [Macrococcus caseolyticus]RAI80188.1 class I SAM-dependent methyltransferase [Macrococcus caseolyticus subsp. hominis]
MTTSNEKRLKELEYHDKFYEMHNLYEKGSWIEKPVNSVIEALSYTKKMDIDVLDLGSGVGRNAIDVAMKIHGDSKVYCIDILPKAIDKLIYNAKKYKVDEKIKAEVSSIEEYDFKKDFDFIIAVSTLEHVSGYEDFVAILNKIKKHTKPNGIVCLIINSEVNEKEIYSNNYIEPQFQINLKSEELDILIRTIFNKFKFLKNESKTLKYRINRDSIEVDLSTNALTFIMQK